MKISKAWCGLFTGVGAGVGLTAYLAHRGSALCQSGMSSLVNSILNADITLTNLSINVNIRHALSKHLIEMLESLPENANDLCKSLAWIQGAAILLTCAGLVGLSIDTYKKFQTLEQRILALENQSKSESESDEEYVQLRNFQINAATTNMEAPLLRPRQQ